MYNKSRMSTDNQLCICDNPDKYIVICVCDKKEMEPPVSMSYKCKKCEVMHTKDTNMLPYVLKSYNHQTMKDLFIGETCRGCKYTKEQQETTYEGALASGIDFCIYQKGSFENPEGDGYEYIGDSLTAEYENYLLRNRIKPKIVKI